MEMYKPEVKDISLFKEIAQNIINPLEIIREGISNSHDAEAKTISIIIYRNKAGKFTIEMQDDGRGMNINDVHRFFNLGDSNKDNQGIGEKGLGTKTYFKSEKISVHTQNREGEAYIATMDKPWEFLCSNLLPEYSIEKFDILPGKVGTSVTIEGFIINNPERYFNFDTIVDYVLWFTAAGSFKTYFANYPEMHKYINNMQIAPRVFIEDRIQNIKEEIAGTHQFSPPQEKPKEDHREVIYKKSANYCRHFGPYHRATNINGDYVSFQMYGTVSGVNCRKSIVKLRQGESLKSRFGLYLAKDFIPFVKKTDLISEKTYHHYHMLLNSQAFELTADRNNISNQEDPKVKWVFEEAKKIISEDIVPLVEEGYLCLRRNEEIEYNLKERGRRLYQRLENYEKIDDLSLKGIPVVKRPDNESQVALLFTALLVEGKNSEILKHISEIGHYSNNSTTDMICIDSRGNKVLVEIEFKLSNLFRHEHPYETFDYVVCWKVDLEVNEKKRLSDGNIMCLIFENNNWMLKYGTQKIIPIIELRKIIDDTQATILA